MRKIPLALQLYSVRGEYRDNPDACLKAIKDMGYEGVEFFGAMDRPAETLKAVLDEIGLPLVGWHTPIEWLAPERLESTIAYMKLVGNRRLICPWLGEEYRNKEALARVSAAFTALVPRLDSEGMRTGYHCHSFDFNQYDGKTGWEIIADNTPKNFILQLDNGNCASSGSDPLSIFKAYPGRGETLHIKPYSGKDGYATMIGEDSINWNETLLEIHSQAATKWLIVEYECEEKYSQLEGARKCLEKLRALGY